jgi:Helix-turn-helix domain
MQPMSKSDYLTLAEVAERYRKTPATIRYWRHIGFGPKGARVGTTVLYPRDEIDKFDEEIRAGDAAAAG